MELCIFDLDGVICDTAKYHFLAWKSLADDLGIAFTEKDNERLKGVSRMESLEILLSLGSRSFSQEEKENLAAEKNTRYLQYIDQMQENEILPGAREFIEDCHNRGCWTALGSVSKNSRRILEKLNITDLFDYIVDGTLVTRAKPDPEVFVRSMRYFSLSPEECVVFEDAVAGIEAAHRAGMYAVGIGDRERLPEADLVLPGFSSVTLSDVLTGLKNR